jgi:hypothetical protein
MSAMSNFPSVALGLTLRGACLLGFCVLAACHRTGPGAGTPWTSYPALSSSPQTYNWLVVKCQVADVPMIPAGLDTNIQQFFGISGAGYGNIVDYFHDVSYNRASVISDTFLGWVVAPFRQVDLQLPNGRLAPSVPGRQKRVQECLSALPADQVPDFDAFYGVVVVNNAVQDGGACYVGQRALTVNNKNHNLACVWFDPNSLKTEFAAHEIAHGLGMTHAFDDSGRNCGGGAGEYCDPWDIMSAQRTYQFTDRNWITAGNPSGGGPGVSAPGLMNMAWIPADNQRRFQFEGDDEQTFNLRALSRPRGKDPLVVLLEVGTNTPFDDVFTVEYRQGDGWDRGFVTDVNNAPAAVRESGGTVLVHQFRPVGGPTSTLVNGSFAGALQPCDTLVLGGGARYITVERFDLADGSATVSIGFGRGKFKRCFKDVLETRVVGSRLPAGRDAAQDPPGPVARTFPPRTREIPAQFQVTTGQSATPR